MVSYVIYHVIQAPFLFIPTHKLQYMFCAKSALVPPMALAMVIWISVKAGGGADLFHEPPSVHGSTRVWLWLMNMTSITGTLLSEITLMIFCSSTLGGFSTLAVNISDFSRFSKKPTSTLWQLPMIPLFKVITGLFGIIRGRCLEARLWNHSVEPIADYQ
jgi:Cytosine/uracil/thiamine/allantoin permeases